MADELLKVANCRNKPYFLDVMVEHGFETESWFGKYFPTKPRRQDESIVQGNDGGLKQFRSAIDNQCMSRWNNVLSSFAPNATPQCQTARYHNIDIRFRQDSQQFLQFMGYLDFINEIYSGLLPPAKNILNVKGAAKREAFIACYYLLEEPPAYDKVKEIFQRQVLFAVREICWGLTQNPRKKWDHHHNQSSLSDENYMNVDFDNEMERDYLYPFVQHMIKDSVFTEARYMDALWSLMAKDDDGLLMEMYSDLTSISQDVYAMRRILKTFKHRSRYQWEAYPSYCSHVIAFEGLFHTLYFSQMLKYFGFLSVKLETTNIYPNNHVSRSRPFAAWNWKSSSERFDHRVENEEISKKMRLKKPPIILCGDEGGDDGQIPLFKYSSSWAKKKYDPFYIDSYAGIDRRGNECDTDVVKEVLKRLSDDNIHGHYRDVADHPYFAWM